MALPPPTPTPSNLELTQVVALSEPSAQKVDAAPLATSSAAVSRVSESQRATPALSPRYARVSVSYSASSRYRPSCTREQQFTAAFVIWTVGVTSANTPEVSPVFS